MADKSPIKSALEITVIFVPLNVQDASMFLSAMVVLDMLAIAGQASSYLVVRLMLLQPSFTPEITTVNATTFPYLYAYVIFVFVGAVN